MTMPQQYDEAEYRAWLQAEQKLRPTDPYIGLTRLHVHPAAGGVVHEHDHAGSHDHRRGH